MRGLIFWALAIGAVIGCSKEQDQDKSSEPVQEAKTPPAEIDAEDTDVDPFAAFAAKHELEVLELEEPETVRSGSRRDPVEPLYPRGNLRATDLDEFRIDVTEDFEPGGTVEFRIGSKVLHREEFDPEAFVNRAPIPDAVRDAVAKGKTVTWGYYPADGRPVTEKFKIVDEPRSLTRKLEKVKAEVGGGNQAWYVQQVHAQLCLKSRLYYAAWREASRITDVRAAAPHAYAVMQRALRKMKLHKSPLWEECQTEAKHVAGIRGRYNPRRAPHVEGRRIRR